MLTITNEFSDECKAYAKQIWEVFKKNSEERFSKSVLVEAWKPMLVYEEEHPDYRAYQIRLSGCTNDPLRFIYQLSHELGHHMINKSKWILNEQGHIVNEWNQGYEEFCEAVSLKMILHFNQRDYYDKAIKHNDEIKNVRWTDRTKQLLVKYATINDLLKSDDFE